MKTEGIIKDESSTLRTRENTADYIVIIGDDSFEEALTSLVTLRESGGLKVKVVEVQDIYDEFNYGIPNDKAIKDYLSYAYKYWNKPAASYVVLVGDASYDRKDNLGLGIKSDYIPTHLVWTPYIGETGWDDWYVCLDGEEDILADMIIGRIPARTKEEVEAVVSKILSYESSSIIGSKKALFLADNDDKFFEESSNTMAGYVPSGWDVSKIYISSYTDPVDANTEVIRKINSGVDIVNYVGHGITDYWASECLLGTWDVESLTNEERFPFIISMTCLDGYYIEPYEYDCMAEALVKAKDKGAIGAFSATGMSDAPGKHVLDEGLFKALFTDKNYTIGSATYKAKMYLYTNSSGREDIIKTHTLFGDPALKLKVE